MPARRKLLTALLVAIPLVGVCGPNSSLSRNEMSIAESGEDIAAFSTSAGGGPETAGRRIPEVMERGRTVCASPSCISRERGSRPLAELEPPAVGAAPPEAAQPAEAIPAAGRRLMSGGAEPRTDSLPTLVAFSVNDPGPAGFFLDLGRSDPLSRAFSTGRSSTQISAGPPSDDPFPGTSGPATGGDGSGAPPNGLPVDLPPFVEGPLPDNGPDADPVAVAALPEPASCALLVGGLLGLAVARRSRRHPGSR